MVEIFIAIKTKCFAIGKQICILSDTGYSLKVYRFALASFSKLINKSNNSIIYKIWQHSFLIETDVLLMLVDNICKTSSGNSRLAILFPGKTSITFCKISLSWSKEKVFLVVSELPVAAVDDDEVVDEDVEAASRSALGTFKEAIEDSGVLFLFVPLYGGAGRLREWILRTKTKHTTQWLWTVF